VRPALRALLAILVDHDLAVVSICATTTNNALCFLGRPDDREALAYAARMPNHAVVGGRVEDRAEKEEVGHLGHFGWSGPHVRSHKWCKFYSNLLKF
jgi:hypothetical protein